MESTRFERAARTQSRMGSTRGWLATYRLVLSSLLVLSLGMGHGAAETSPQPQADSVDVRIRVEREGDQLRVRGQLINREGPTGTVHYELVVRRRGAAGTARMAQTGTVETGPGQADTLSTVRVNARGGDQLQCRLDVRTNRQAIGAARRAWTVRARKPGV